MKINSRRCKIGKFTDRITYGIELVISAIIIVTAITLLYNIISYQILKGHIWDMGAETFRILLGQLLNITVGIEFVKLLIKQRITELIEVVLLVITRQIVVQHLTVLQMLMGVVAIGVLFMIRKYLLLELERKSEETKGTL